MSRVGMVVGVPLSLALGHVIWKVFAIDVGAVLVSTVPAALIAAAGVLVADPLAVVPRSWQRRSKTAGHLLTPRSEPRSPLVWSPRHL